MPAMPDMALPLTSAVGTLGDQAAGLRRLMARRLPPSAAGFVRQAPELRFGLLAQDPALAAWMHAHLAAVRLKASVDASPGATDPVLLAVHAHAAALPQALTWAYAQIKRAAQQDASLPDACRLLPRLHLVLVGVQGDAQAQLALTNMAAAVQRHLGLALPPGAWLCSAPPSGAQASDAQSRASLALDFCRLAAELRQWPAAA